ncbi:MAG: 4-alpha-glucanotransferase [Gammaproteobacteria bacterium]|nr:4-alpha-glucanotransferase [Gammaproteobacteria bacterium]
MPITDHDRLDALCASCGIALEYRDIRGQRHEPGFEVKQSLLAALQLPVNSDDDVRQRLEQVQSGKWCHLIAPVVVCRQNEVPIRLTLTLADNQVEGAIKWQLHQENGQLRQGEWKISTQDSVDEAVVDGTRLRKFEVVLPELEAIGYHRLIVQADAASEAQAILLVAPDACYQPPGLANGRKIWGVSLQLFSLRSKRNWGIGDFTDLQSVIDILAPLGINLLGLNPLHALFPHLPANASPYSPSSRGFLNPVYLDVEAIDEFKQGPEVMAQVNNEEFQSHLQALRELELIDYPGVWGLKFKVLGLLYEAFKQQHHDTDSTRLEAFRQFQQNGGEELFKFALFEALQAFFYRQDAAIEQWQQWPEAYRDPASETVTRWADEHADDIEFHQYLQWNAEQQLSAAHENCKRHGMCLGIYRDLAVGDARSSAQCWAEQADYALDIGIGAPPDDFNSNGQDWALPPLKPQALREHAYQPFIRTLRANMRHAGALRIDHIMGLMRLFWVPPDGSPEQGTYVSYPFADLLGIVALESHRHQCLVVGEDLGTVPDEVRQALDTNKMLSFRILNFEKDWQHGTIRPPGDYPRYSLCTSGSHDLPTLPGFWQETDLELREQLGLYPSQESRDQQRQVRQQDRCEILKALARENLVASEAIDEMNAATGLGSELARSIQRYLARARSMLFMVQLEDLLLETRQVNVPGTIDEYPNWRGRLSVDLEDWHEQVDLEGFARAVNTERDA